MTRSNSLLATCLLGLLTACGAGPKAIEGRSAAGPEDWRPEVRTPPFSIASVESEVLATLELRLLRVSPDQADAWTSRDRSALRIALLPDLRLRQVLNFARGRAGPKAYAPKVTVRLGQEARIGVQAQHVYVRDYALPHLTADPLTLTPVLGAFETGLRCRLRVQAEEDAGWDASLRTWVKLRGELHISELIELEELHVEHPELVAKLEIPKLEVRRHALDLELQPEQVALLAPPMGPQSEDQIVVLILVTLSGPEASRDAEAPSPPAPELR